MTDNTVTPIDRNKRLHHLIETRQRAKGRVYEPPIGEAGFDEEHIATDGAGKVLAMPDVPVRECFGDGITFLVHGRASLCLGCPAREACVPLVHERIGSDDELTEVLMRYARQLLEIGDIAPDLANPAWSTFVDRWAAQMFAYGNDNRRTAYRDAEAVGRF